MTRAMAGWLAAAAILVAGPLKQAAAQDTSFDIARFQVDGNTLLAADRVEALVAPYAGKGKGYGDVQKALEALEGEFRRLGYGTVQVYVPEQELTGGVVRLVVSEGVIGKVAITGNKHFNEENVRASLPSLKEGTAPNMRTLSENIQLSNENPAKQVEVTLAVSEEEGKVNARVDVKEEEPSRFFVTLDNTGNKATGYARIGVSYQNANLFNSDQILTLSYMTALDPPGRMKIGGWRALPWSDGDGVKLDIYSIGYRLPMYSLGDSIDFIYANSSTNTPSTTTALGSSLGINGKGDVFSLRYNHNFARAGEYTSKAVLAYDYKYLDNTCSTGGIKTPFGVAGCTPYTLRPISATYVGQWQKPGENIDFYVSAAKNLPTGADYPFPGALDPQDNYSAATGWKVRDDYSVLRAGGSYFAAIGGDWLVRAALNGQYAHHGLPNVEQLGLTGWTTVRGFNERVIARDRGYVANLEIYTPDMAASMGLPGSFKFLGFYDSAQGFNIATATNEHVAIAAVGVGLRYNLKKDISARFDVARVVDGYTPKPPAFTVQSDDMYRGHVGVAFGF
ncbi:MAG: ShlB/FhaC/HecB family hemolysin secretion/activation protein [Betaproteobacteria bacterium]|nr:ShlB/FhaC/HecB family hemolysin secretion/activation protein [Betaproteobacteria bacterium]